MGHADLSDVVDRAAPGKSRPRVTESTSEIYLGFRGDEPSNARLARDAASARARMRPCAARARLHARSTWPGTAAAHPWPRAQAHLRGREQFNEPAQGDARTVGARREAPRRQGEPRAVLAIVLAHRPRASFPASRAGG